jgi:membrane associated rhomboid family serine protease
VEAIILLVPLAIWIAMIWASVTIANTKGRSPVLWGILAALFGLIPLIIVAILPPAEPGY